MLFPFLKESFLQFFVVGKQFAILLPLLLLYLLFKLVGVRKHFGFPELRGLYLLFFCSLYGFVLVNVILFGFSVEDASHILFFFAFGWLDVFVVLVVGSVDGFSLPFLEAFVGFVDVVLFEGNFDVGHGGGDGGVGFVPVLDELFEQGAVFVDGVVICHIQIKLC